MMATPADSTGGSTTSKDGSDKILSQSQWKYFPSIEEQGLSEKSNRKRLQTLFNKYLKPEQNATKSLDIQKVWGK